MTREARAEAEEARRFIHTVDKEKRSVPPRTLSVIMSSRPLDEGRKSKATNLGARHFIRDARKGKVTEYALSWGESAYLRWCENYYGRKYTLKQLMPIVRRGAITRLNFDDELDIARKIMLTNAKYLRKRKFTRAARVRKVELTQVRELRIEQVFNAAEFGRNYALTHSLEALALYGKLE